MARYIQEYCLREAKDRSYLTLCHFLKNKGYATQQYKGEPVFCKGSSAIGNETMVKISYPTGMVRVEAWLKTMPIPGIIDGEVAIDGYYGWALKSELKSIVLELDKMLGGAPNRIGTHPYLAKKDAEGQQPSLFSFQSSKPQKSVLPIPRVVEQPVPQPKPTPRSQEPTPQPKAATKAQPAPQPRMNPTPQPVGAAVDINRCTQDELMSLPGIGVAQAKKALEYRAQNGGFRSLDEFVDVLQIKPHFAVQIFDRATVSQPAPKSTPQPAPGKQSRRTIDF